MLLELLACYFTQVLTLELDSLYAHMLGQIHRMGHEYYQ